MGSKGSQQTQTAQQQTYQPDPYARQATEAALGQAQNVAQTPFRTPVAPVAGFSPQQQQAFQATEAAQGYAQPYINQAQQYFSPQGTQSFLNPYTANVTANLQDIFGQQMSQATGQAVQQAGGQGADRVAVAQSQLAKQQALAAGQTYAGLYGNAAQLAQGAGFGTANLGTAGQNAALQGAGALLGTGGLQQQLEQARLNAPYQNILQQIAWPYQNSQFLSGAVGALAPGLGGTTAGTGSNIYPGASNLGTIAGLGLAGVGAYGIGNKQGWWGSGTDTGGGSQPEYAAAEGVGEYSARGGRINPYARGGDADDDTSFSMPTAAAQNDPIRYAEMQQLEAAGSPGAVQTGQQSQLPSGVSGQPVDVTPKSLVPQTQLVPIKPTIPQLNLSQPQGGGGSGGGKGSGMSDVASIVGSVAKIAPLLMMARGGSANPHEHLDEIRTGMHRVFGRGGSAHPYAYQDGGELPINANNEVARRDWGAGELSDVANADNLQAMEYPMRREALRRSPTIEPQRAAGIEKLRAPMQARADALAPPAEPTDVGAAARPSPGKTPYATDELSTPDTTRLAANEPPLDTTLPSQRGTGGMFNNPWGMALMAGLGTLAASGQRDARGLPTPPLAAIGQGALAGIKEQQSIEDASKKLDLAAKQELDKYSRMTPHDKAQIDLAERAERNKWTQMSPYQRGELEKPIVIGGQLVDRAGNVLFKGAGFTDSTIEIGARQMINGDMSPLANVGRGAQGDQKITALRNKMTELLMNEQGMSATDAAAHVSSAIQQYKAAGIGLNAGARTAAVREENLNLILKATQAAIPAALEQSEKVWRTGFVPLNKIIQKGQLMTSNAELGQFGMANLQLAEHWARAMNPTGVMRESDRDKAMEFLSTATSPATYRALVQQLQTQITRERDSIRGGHASNSIVPPQPGAGVTKTIGDKTYYQDAQGHWFDNPGLR